MCNEIPKIAPKPEYNCGDVVEVILSDLNKTYRKGHVRERIWHYKNQVWYYYLEVEGKKVSKRYRTTDLRPIIHIR